MTHLIEQNDHYVAGETTVWEFTIERNGTPKDLTGASVEWYLVPSRGDDDADALLDHTDSGVTAEVVGDPVNGRVDVDISSGTTDSLGGDKYWQRLIVVDNANDTQIWNGDFPIRER